MLNKKETPSSVEIFEGLKAVKQKTRYSKVIFPGDVAIFKEMVFLYNWASPYKLIVIKDKNLAKEYLDFFLNLWGKSKK